VGGMTPSGLGHARAAIGSMLFRSPSPINPRRKWQTTLVRRRSQDFPNPVEVRGQPSFSLTIQQVFHPTMSPISRQTDNFLNQ